MEGATRIVMPNAMAAVGPYIVVADAEAPFLRVFDRATGNSIATAGRAGEGPGEFRTITYLSAVPERDRQEIVAYDVRQQLATRWAITKDGITQSAAPVRLSGGASPAFLMYMPQREFLAVGAFAPTAFTIYDSVGVARSHGGDVPYIGDRVPPSLAQQIIAGRPAMDPSGRHVAIAARYAGRIDIYDISSGTRLSASVPLPFEPKIQSQSNGAMQVFVTDGDTEFGYVEAAGSECCIYALFSGRTRSSFPGRAFASNLLHVFDWSGHLLREYQLAEDLVLITVDQDGKHLLGLTLVPEPAVLRYDVSH